MGAWTSTFTISFTLAYAPSTIHQPFLQLKDVSIPNQPLLREKDSNLRPLGYEPSELPLLYLAMLWRWG